jgi:uncharacterized membrane protein YbhN (UPF0104 family)
MSYQERFGGKNLVVYFKILVSIAAIAIIVVNFDVQLFLLHWHKISAPAIVTAFVVLVAETTVVAGMRLKLLLQGLGYEHKLVRTSQITLCGFFVEQVAFGFVGGDAMRIWLLHGLGISLSTAVTAIVIDRCLGLIALVLLVMTGFPGLLQIVPDFLAMIAILTTGVLVAAMIAGVIFNLLSQTRFRTQPGYIRLVELCKEVSTNPALRRCLVLTLGLAVLTHLMNVLVFVVIGRELALPITTAQWWIIIPPVLLFSMIPISAGGWGLREGVFVFALGHLGVPAEEAIVPSLIFGLSVLFATLPGVVVWLAHLRRIR